MEGNRDSFSVEDWERKLRQQEEESREYRHILYEKVGLKEMERILDVGCGTGAVTKDIADFTNGNVIAMDIDRDKLDIARKYLEDVENVDLIEGDAVEIPFPDGSFDLVVFNIVLIYINDQQKAINEMARVTKKGGIVMATLEPDYESGLDYPEDPLYPLHLKRMKELGADLRTGRKLKYLFTSAGLETDVGMDTVTDYVYIRDNVKMLEMFLDQFWVARKIFLENGWKEEEIMAYREQQIDLIKKGLKFHFSSAFYAIGRK